VTVATAQRNTAGRDRDDDTPELPEGCPLAKLYRKRVAQKRDLTVLIADWNLERGTGKTTLAMKLAAAMDRTDEGLTGDKTTLSAQELTDAYTEQPLGSSLILDEGQADASNRRSMSGINEALRKIVGMGRVEQKYLFLTAPGVHQVDRDIRNMCDVWIFCRQLGEAQMFRVKYNPFENHELTNDWGTLKWDGDLPPTLEATYDDLTAEKKRRLRGDGDDGDGYVKAEEASKSAEQAAKKAERQTRDDMIRRIYENNSDMTQKKLAESVGLSRSRVADILGGD
jgi:DNA-binding XRE family transcriptional regulator